MISTRWLNPELQRKKPKPRKKPCTPGTKCPVCGLTLADPPRPEAKEP